MESLKIYNTLSKKLEEFKPSTPGQVKMYICGPTVYDSPHIGHARTYIGFDVIRRILSEYFRYDVKLVMNITDIDDKIITRAAERGMECGELSEKYEDEFFDAMDQLGVARPTFVTRVTAYVEECVCFIERLEDRGLAYASRGSVYFDLTKYKESFDYNLLRPATVQEDASEFCSEKRGAEDFVLWKASRAGEPTYEARWGPGRPGWHIECSAMSTAIFGSTLDIHAGGIDLAFPHHENEIAQCQGHSGHSWVNYFLHTGHLNINGLKMSKSLKNFLTIGDILETTTPENLRLLFLQHAWNKEMNYEPEQLREAAAVHKRIANFCSNAQAAGKRGDRRALNAADMLGVSRLDETQDAVHVALCDNLNTPRVLDAILKLIASTNLEIKTLHSDVIRAILSFVRRILGIFGILKDASTASDKSEDIAAILCDFRSKVRAAAKAKEQHTAFFSFSDDARDSLKQLGFVIDDSPTGSVLRKV